MLKALNYYYDSLGEPWHMMIALLIGAGLFQLLLSTYWAWLPICLILLMRMVYGPRTAKVTATNDTLSMVWKGDSYEAEKPKGGETC